MDYNQLTQVAVFGALGSFLVWLIQQTVGKIIDYQSFRRMEKLKREIFLRDQAASVAEYFSLAWQLHQDDDKQSYQNVNRLAWQLAIYLPADVYRHVALAVAKPSEEVNIATAIIEVRKMLREEKCATLTEDDILSHFPDVGDKLN